MIKDFTKENPRTSLIGGIIIVVLIQSYDPFVFLTNILNIIDTYLKLILTSWPAVVLILGVMIFPEHLIGMRNFILKKIHSPKDQDQSPS